MLRFEHQLGEEGAGRGGEVGYQGAACTWQAMLLAPEVDLYALDVKNDVFNEVLIFEDEIPSPAIEPTNV